jgi:hypothetical protein
MKHILSLIFTSIILTSMSLAHSDCETNLEQADFLLGKKTDRLQDGKISILSINQHFIDSYGSITSILEELATRAKNDQTGVAPEAIFQITDILHKMNKNLEVQRNNLVDNKKSLQSALENCL